MKHLGEAIKSYEGYADEYEEDSEELAAANKVIIGNAGHIENLKAEVRQELEEQNASDDEITGLFEIEFSADQKANLEEIIDSFYISQLLRDIKNEESKRKFDEIIQTKPDIVKTAYDEALSETDDTSEVVTSVDRHFKRRIEDIVAEVAAIIQVPNEDLGISFTEYRADKEEVPYINTIIGKSTLSKAEFEQAFPGELFRRRSAVINEYLRSTFAEKLMPLRNELANFNSEGDNV